MLQDIDLNKLRAFLAVYDHQSVTEAGVRLNISPSAISQALRGLEKELGFRLFQRLNKRLRPTPEAKSLAQLVQGFIGELSSWKSEALNQKKELSGLLRIGAPPELGSHRLISALSEFAKKEEVRFKIEVGLPDHLMVRLAGGELDLVICDQGPYIKKYKSSAVWQSIFVEEAILVCSKSFYSAHLGKSVTYKRLIELPHVDYREDAKVLALWYKYYFAKVPGDLKLRLVTSQVSGVVAAARAGFGLAFIPTYLIEEDLKRGRLIKIKTTRPDYKNVILLVQMKDKVPSLLEKRVVEVLTSRF